MTNPPTGTITFLFTDIEGSTKRWERFPDEMRSALKRHDALLRNSIEANSGYVFKTVGDAFCAAFPTALDALQAAVTAQDALQNEDWHTIGRGKIGPIKVRMALHTGTAEEWDGDYFGQPVNRVARLLSAGHGGQTLLSQAAYQLVRDQLPHGVEMLDFGERRLKDLIRPEHVFQLVAPGLLFEFPPLKTLDARPNNLPAQPSPFIGREKEIAGLSTLLRRQEVRIVTLTGPGGTGKTRLALQAAADMFDEFEDGVYFVNLAPIADSGLVASTIAQILGVREAADTPLVNSLKDYLRDKQMLLVLDNFEQVVSAAPLVSELVAAAPGLKVLATSRELLHLNGEYQSPVSPLALPDPKHLPPIERLTQYEAVRLFVERALAVKPDFQVTNDNAPAVAEICVRLDGLPLAIELAAARVRLLPPQAMLARLENKLKMPTGGARDLPTRQQTLRGAIDWSYDLLDEGEKALFRRLSVFVGGRSLEAAEAVCNPEGDLPIDVVDGMLALVDKSLLRQEEGKGDMAGEPRFFMLVTIRDYAIERLEESGEADRLRREHANFFLKLAEEAEQHLTGAEQVAWLSRLEDEHDNLRAALGWSTGAGGYAETASRLCWALWRFWARHSYYTEGRSWFEAALQAGSEASAPLRAKALYGLGVMLKRQGQFESALSVLEEALALFREQGDKLFLSWVLNDLGSVSNSVGDLERAATFLEESLALKRELGNKWDIAGSLTVLGEWARLQDDYERAAALNEESLALCREMDKAVDKHSMGYPLGNLGSVEIRRGNYERATLLLAESLAIFREVGDKQVIAMCLASLAGVAGFVGQPEKAARLFSATAAQLEEISSTLDTADQRDYDLNLAAARAQLDEAAWQAAWAEGRAMSMEQAIEYALE